MKKFLRNCKGAVTVMVTLLMIPAILVSGTAVDAARIYMTRNSVQNANQLAANASLASYNALLKDMYGLYGFMSDDPGLAAMIDEYIKVTIYGSDPDKGTFRSFIGSDAFTTEMDHSGNLRDTEVLKQQILEYMKFRGPAILVGKLLGSLDSDRLRKLEQDSEVLELKKEIDDGMEDIFKKYSDLYYAIMRADSVRASLGDGYESVGRHFARVTEELEGIRDDFEELVAVRDEYNSATILHSQLEELENRYDSILADISTRAGRINKHLEDSIQVAESFHFRFDAVVSIATDLDQKKEALKMRVADLRAKLEGDCSAEIRAGFLDPPQYNPADGIPLSEFDDTPLIDKYSKLLDNEVAPMAVRYKAEGYKYIDDVLLPALRELRTEEPIEYRDSKVETNDENSLTLVMLSNITNNPSFAISSSTNRARFFAGSPDLPPDDPDKPNFQDLAYHLPLPFYRFGNEHFPPDQVQFWKDLESMVKGGSTAYVDLFSGSAGGSKSNSSDGTEKAQRNQLGRLDRESKGTDSDLPSSGAQWINDPEWSGTSGDSFDFGKLAKNIVSVVSDTKGILRNSVDYALILTYDMTNFSHYTTNKHGKGPEQSIAGIPINARVNYYYQSEWEYLLVGKEDAKDNLNTIKNLIRGIRLVLNFIALWNINEINTVVNIIRAIPLPFGLSFALAEAVRFGLFFAETEKDISRLRNGCKVALFKDNSTWVCKPSTLWKLTTSCVCDEGGTTLTYENYLTVFFIAKATATSDPTRVLVNRTADLIEWNVNNYRQDFKANAGEMTAFLDINSDGYDDTKVFRMRKAATTFEIETTVEMRMLFLSMPLAQRGINGVVPPKTLTITATDHRGY